MTLSCLLLTCLVAPIAGEIDPLPEERGITSRELIAHEFVRAAVDEVGTFAWQELHVERFERDGKPGYLVELSGELADFTAPGLRVMESRSLYDQDLKLVREQGVSHIAGSKAELIDAKWEESGLRIRTGRGTWEVLPDAPRPTASSEVILLAFGTSIEFPYALHILDSETREVTEASIVPAGEVAFDDGTAQAFDVTGPKGYRHLFRRDGVYLQTSRGEAIFTALNFNDETSTELRRELADNSKFEPFLDAAATKAWERDGRKFENEVLGLSITLPKLWKRTEQGHDLTFVGESPDGNSAVLMDIVVLGSGYPLEPWANGLEGVFVDFAKDGEVKRTKTKLGKADAVRFEYTDRESSLVSINVSFKHRGLGITLYTVGDPESRGSKKEIQSFLRKVRLLR